MQNQNSITSKRFVIRKSLIGKNTVVIKQKVGVEMCSLHSKYS